MTRITTANAFDNSVRTLQERAREVSTAQSRLTSGKRISQASDDPTAAARVERALAAQARSEADQRGLEASRNAMQQTEGALGQADDLMQLARELVVQAGNGSYSDAERANLGQRLRGVRDQLLAVANRGDGAGGHLFGGQGAAQPPFVDAAGGVQYRGQGGQMKVVAGEPLPMTQDGAETWLQAPSGNGAFETAPAAGNSPGAWIDAGRPTNPAALTGANYQVVFAASAGAMSYSVLKNGAATALANQPYVAAQAIEFDGMAVAVNGSPVAGDSFDVKPATPSLSVFAALDRAASELTTPYRSGAQVAQTVHFGLRDIDASLGRLQSRRADAGETLNRTDAIEQRLSATSVAAQSERSLAEDLDMVAGVSAFQNKQSGYDAALKTYAMVQRLSLFQYLNV